MNHTNCVWPISSLHALTRFISRWPPSSPLFICAPCLHGLILPNPTHFCGASSNVSSTIVLIVHSLSILNPEQALKTSAEADHTCKLSTESASSASPLVTKSVQLRELSQIDCGISVDLFNIWLQSVATQYLSHVLLRSDWYRDACKSAELISRVVLWVKHFVEFLGMPPKTQSFVTIVVVVFFFF